MSKKKDEPTFDKQLETYSLGETDSEDPIFSHAYQKFIINLLMKRDKAVMAEMRTELLIVLEPWWTKFEEILKNQSETLKNQEEMKNDLAVVKEIGLQNRVRIESLEHSVEMHNKILEGHNILLSNLNKIVNELSSQHNLNHPARK